MKGDNQDLVKNESEGEGLLTSGIAAEKLGSDNLVSRGFMQQSSGFYEGARYLFCITMSLPDGMTYHVYAIKNGRLLREDISNSMLGKLIEAWLGYGAPTGVALFALNNMIRWTVLLANMYTEYHDPKGIQHKSIHLLTSVFAALSVTPFYGMAKHGDIPEAFAIANAVARFCMDYFAWFTTLVAIYESRNKFKFKPYFTNDKDCFSGVLNTAAELLLFLCGMTTACYLYPFARDEAGEFLAVAGVMPTALLWGHDSLTGMQIMFQGAMAKIKSRCRARRGNDGLLQDDNGDISDTLLADEDTPLADDESQETGSPTPSPSFSGKQLLRASLVMIALAGACSETMTAANNAHAIGISSNTMRSIAGIAFTGIYATGPLQLIERVDQLYKHRYGQGNAQRGDQNNIWDYLQQPTFASTYPRWNLFLYISCHAIGAIGSWVFYRLGEDFADKISSGSSRAGLRIFFGITSFIPGALISARSTYDDLMPFIEALAGSSPPLRRVPIGLKAFSLAILLTISFSYGLQRMYLTHASRHVPEPWQSMAEYCGFISAFAIAYCVFDQLRQQLVYEILKACKAVDSGDCLRQILLRIQQKRSEIDNQVQYVVANSLQELLTVTNGNVTPPQPRSWITVLALSSSTLSAYAYYPVGRDGGKYLSETSTTLQTANATSTFLGLLTMYFIVTKQYFPMILSRKARDETQFRAQHWTRGAAACLATGFALLAPIPPMVLAINAFESVEDSSVRILLQTLFTIGAFFSHVAYSYFAMHSSVSSIYDFLVPPQATSAAGEGQDPVRSAKEEDLASSAADKDIDLARLGRLKVSVFNMGEAGLRELSSIVQQSGSSSAEAAALTM